MNAVFQLSGFQFTATEGDVLTVPRQKSPVGETFDITDVLLVKGKDATLVGTPVVDGAKIQAEILGHSKAEKVTVFKKRRRTKYRRTRGHRQEQTEIKITKIVAP